MLLPCAVDLVDPPGEVDQQLVEAALQEGAVGLAGADPGHVVDPPDGPGVDRRVRVGELPLVGRDLAVGVLELLEQQDPELVHGVPGVDQGVADAVERQVPGGEPGILPLVGDRHHPQRVQVPPVLVPDRAAATRAADNADRRLRARRSRRRCSSAWSRAGRPAPGAGCAARRRWPRADGSRRRTRRPPPAAARRSSSTSASGDRSGTPIGEPQAKRRPSRPAATASNR